MNLSLSNATVLVIGDCILDQYVYGDAVRLSPEAPVPIVRYANSEYRLGGAGNVAANIKALGGNPLLITVCGTDKEAGILETTIHETGIHTRHLLAARRITTHKTRFIANRQQVMRLDNEETGNLPAIKQANIINALEFCLDTENVAAVVISDYNKGAMSDIVMTAILDKTQQKSIPVFLDPKIKHGCSYKGVTVVTPNVNEAAELTGIRIVDKISLEAAGRSLLNSLECNYVLITRGEDGMTLFESGSWMMLDIPTEAQSVYDVSGAGDTVIATLALAKASGMNMRDAAVLANKAAGIVVGKPGTAVVTKEELENSCRNR